LNLGHTTGHSFESFAIGSGRPVPHGYAVAWGLIVELYLSHRICNFPKDKLLKTVRFIQQHSAPFPSRATITKRCMRLPGTTKECGEQHLFYVAVGIGNVQIDQTAGKELFLKHWIFTGIRSGYNAVSF